jgi:hypothetical protein
MHPCIRLRLGCIGILLDWLWVFGSLLGGGGTHYGARNKKCFQRRQSIVTTITMG